MTFRKLTSLLFGIFPVGLVRKGLFAGLDDNGNEMMYEGKVLTTYDAKTGKAITSKGNSEIAGFFTYSAKLGLQYHFAGGHRIYANAGYFNDAPTFACLNAWSNITEPPNVLNFELYELYSIFAVNVFTGWK